MISIFLCLAACSTPDTDKKYQESWDSGDEDVSRSYPLDDVLRFNHGQVLGTHNSYHLMPEQQTVPDWEYEHPPLDVQLGQCSV